MTKITKYIEEAKGKTLFSIEIIPPVKGESIQTLMNNIEPLMEFQPPFIEVTYHREEFIEKVINGRIEKIPTRKRPGTAGFVPEKGGHAYASELLEQVVSMNQGKLLHEETESTPTNFCIGVAGYPEKHFEAPNFQVDFEYLRRKVALGADYIVTQMFFDNQKYFDFVKKCREEGINVPIIPGLKPLATRKQLTVLPRIFHLDIPIDLVNAVNACKSDKDVKQVGIEWCIQQCKELMDFGAPILHFYTMSKSESTQKIAQAIF